MMNIKKMMRGFSLLLGLGVFAFMAPNDAWAKCYFENYAYDDIIDDMTFDEICDICLRYGKTDCSSQVRTECQSFKDDPSKYKTKSAMDKFKDILAAEARTQITECKAQVAAKQAAKGSGSSGSGSSTSTGSSGGSSSTTSADGLLQQVVVEGYNTTCVFAVGVEDYNCGQLIYNECKKAGLNSDLNKCKEYARGKTFYSEAAKKVKGGSSSSGASTPASGSGSSGSSSSGSSSGSGSNSGSSSSTGSPISTKTIDVSKIEKNKNKNLEDLGKQIQKLGFECADAANAKNDYSSKADAYKAAAEALNSAIQQVTSACNKYSKMKTEYNSCLSGGKGVDVSSVRSAQQAADSAERAMNSALSSAESSISSCKGSGKDSKKADKAAEKAQDKVDDLVKDAKKLGINCDSGQTCIDMLQGAYDNCSDPKLCKKYKKLLDELKEKQGTLDDALKTKEEAEQAKLNSQCKSPWVWNKNANACAPSATWSKEEYDDYQEFINECERNSDGTYDTRCENLAKKYGKSGGGDGASDGGLNADGTSLGGGNQSADYEECEKETDPAAKQQCIDEVNDFAKRMCEKGGQEFVMGDDGHGYCVMSTLDVKPDGKLHCPRLDEIGTGSDNTIFDYLTCRITDLLIRIRMIVYVLAGFGMIAFAYGAIIGKISFKQLANIGIGLFILSMTTSVIEYVVFPKNSGQHLKYGNYLKDGHTLESVEAERDAIRSRSGSGGSSSAGGMSQSSCEKNPSLCPDSSWLSEKPSSSWSIGDIKNSISSIADAVSTGINTFNTVSHAVSTASSAISKIGDAISGENDATRSAKANLERANENLSYARQNAAAARQAQAMAQEAYDAAQENVNSYNELVSNKKAEMDALSKALKSGDLSAANPETLSAMADAEAKLAEDKARLALLQDVKDLDKLKKSAEAADKKVADIEAQLAALDPEAHPSQKAAYDALQKKLAEAKAAADGLHSRVDAAEAEANNPDLDLQSEMASLKTAVADDEYNLNAAKAKAKTEIQDQLAEMKGDLDGLQADLKEAQATANSAKKDLNSANSEAKKAENAVSSAENVVSNCERNLENAKNSVGNFFDRMSQAASNVDKLTTTISNTANTVAKNSSRITNDVVDSTQNSAQREKKDKIKQERNRMEQKCSKNPSKCTSEELDYLAQLQDADDNNTNAVDKYLNSDAPGGGKTILDNLGKTSNLTGSARNTANAAKSGYNSGKSAGNSVAGKGSALGDVLGVAGGIAKGTVTGVNEDHKNADKGNYDYRSGETKRNDAANQK